MKNDFTIGADPEFCCITESSNVVRADAILPWSAMEDALGIDGSGFCLEARPYPSVDPLQVVRNIHDILLNWSGSHNVVHYKWIAGSRWGSNALGGHIHFGIKTCKSSGEAYNASSFLSQYLAPLSILIEKHSDARFRRISRQYGYPTDYRTNHHGFEYRTPSSWITSPYIAAAHLCLAKALMYDYLFVKTKRFPIFFALPSLDEIQNAGEVSSEVLRPYMHREMCHSYFNDIWRQVTQLTLYPLYKAYIDIFHYLITNKLTWFPKCSMREAWGIPDKQKLGQLPQSDSLSLSNIWKSLR